MEANYSFSIIEDNSIIIGFSRKIMCEEWINQWGSIRERVIKEKAEKITLDFMKLEYIESIPILSLFTLLEQLVSENNEIKIKFIFKENFSLFKEYLNLIKHYSHEEIDILHRSSGIKTIQAEIGYIENESEIQEIVDKLMRQLEKTNTSISMNNYNSFMTKLYNILYESLENIYNHAYDNEERKQYAVLIRLLDNKSLLKNNHRYPDRNKETFLETFENFIEVSILDNGVGLLKRLGCHLAKAVNSIFFHDRRTIEGMKSAKNKTSSRSITNIGGLHLLNQYMQLSHDLVEIYTNSEYGSFFPSGYDKNRNSKMAASKLINYKEINGLSYTFSLSWHSKDIREHETISPSFFKGNQINNPVYLSKLNNEFCNSKSLKNIFFIDERNKISDLSTDLNKIKTLYNIFETNNNISWETDIWLPESKLTKDDIQKLLKIFLHKKIASFLISEYEKSGKDEKMCTRFKSLLNKTKREDVHDIENSIEKPLLKELGIGKVTFKSKTLFIGDVKSNELPVFYSYINGLGKVYQNENIDFINKNYKYIYIISVNCEVYCFEQKVGVWERNIDLEKKFFESEIIDPESVITNCLHYIWWLKYYESRLFWIEIEKRVGENYFFNADITWGKDKKLSSYLNMEKVLNNHILYKYIKRALLRCIAYDENKSVKFYSTSILVEPLVNECNLLVKRKDRNYTEITVSSVFSTGKTVKSSDKLEFSNIINLFVNLTSSTGQYDEKDEIFEKNDTYKTSLFLWPKEDFAQKTFPHDERKFKRLGYLYLITPEDKEGEYSITINKNHTSFLETYLKKIDENFSDFQSTYPQFARIGHYMYRGDHDFLNINYPTLIKNSIITMDKAIVFIVKCIYKSMKELFDINNVHLDGKWEKECNKLKRKISIKKSYLLVYPNHTHSKLLINCLNEVFPEEVSNYFLPINFITYKDRKNSRVSPTFINDINLKIKELKNKGIITKTEELNIIFFDTLLVSGVTRKMVKHMLLSNLIKEYKVSNVLSLALVDRRRLPYLAPDSNMQQIVWRYEIPRLGTSNNCILCKGINYLNQVIERYSDDCYETVRKKILNWIQYWEVSDIGSNKENTGITIENLEKAFIPTMVDGYKPKLVTNYGLILYITELHSIDIRNNLLIEFLNLEKENLSDVNRLECICVSFLLFEEINFLNFRNLINILFTSLIKIESNSCTALACIILLCLDRKLVIKLLLDYLTNNEIELKQNDFTFFLSYLYNNEKNSKKVEILGKSLSESEKNYFSFNKYCKYMFLFHSYIVNDQGEVHSTNIYKLCHKSYSLLKKNTYYDLVDRVISDIKKIIGILENINNLYSNDEKVVWEKINLDSINELLDKLLNLPNYNKLEEMKKNSLELYEKLFQMHNKSFIRLGINEKYSSKKIIEEIDEIVSVCKFKANLNYNRYPNYETIDCENSEIWYFWGEDIKNELIYFFDNVRHIAKDKGKANIFIKPNKKVFTVEMENWSKDNFETIIKKMNEKQNVRISMLSAVNKGVVFDGECIGEEEGKYKIRLSISIPSTISYCLKI